MSAVELKLHLLMIEHKVAPLDADMSKLFGLGKAPEILDPDNVAAVTVGKDLRAQNRQWL